MMAPVALENGAKHSFVPAARWPATNIQSETTTSAAFAIKRDPSRIGVGKRRGRQFEAVGGIQCMPLNDIADPLHRAELQNAKPHRMRIARAEGGTPPAIDAAPPARKVLRPMVRMINSRCTPVAELESQLLAV